MSNKAEQMLPAIVAILRERGPEGFILSSIAEDLGTSSRMLIYHFGSRDELLGKVMKVVREETIEYLVQTRPTSLIEAINRWWEYYMNHLSDMQLFFHLASRRFEEPTQFEEFASTAVERWIRYFADSVEAEGKSPTTAVVLGRLTIAALRGLVVDYLITEDREWAEKSLEAYRELVRAE